MKKNILITGGAGFIGSNLVKKMCANPDYMIYNLDALTYCGNLDNLTDVENLPNYEFVHGTIWDEKLVESIFEKDIDIVMHLAAESHVDNSILNPNIFEETNVKGTMVLLNAAKKYWEGKYDQKLFIHISTDEVYGALELDGDDKFTEETPYNPHSPYSASKASSDFFVRAYHDTYGLPTIVTHCSNNYGPYQYPEKLIPLTIQKIKDKEPIPIYGNGMNVRDWIHVDDHCDALITIMNKGKVGEMYNIGGNCEMHNIDIVKKLIYYADFVLGRKENEDMNLISFVEDRKGHDLRYAIDNSKIKRDLGWSPKVIFDEGLLLTVKWYLNNWKYIEDILEKQKNYKEIWQQKRK